MNHNTPQPTSRLGLPKGNSTLQRVLIFGGGLFLLIIVGLVAMSLFSGGGSSTQLLGIAQEQTEIIRIADLANSERTVRSTTTKNLAASTSITVGTSRSQTLALIGGKTPDSKILGSKKSSKTDAALAEAASNNQYDAVFTETLTTKLKAYQTNVKALYTTSKSKKEKAVLESAFNGTVILLGENTSN